MVLNAGNVEIRITVLVNHRIPEDALNARAKNQRLQELFSITADLI
jgi:hypothetical protein